MDKERLGQPLAGDGQERMAGVQARDLAAEGDGKMARSTPSAPGVEEMHSRFDFKGRERVLPQGAAERFLQIGPITRSRTPQLALSFT